MPNAEGDAGNDDGRLDIVLCDGHKQKSSEDHFLQKSNTEHTCDTADRFHRCVIEGNTIPKVSRCQNYKRHIIEEPAGRDKRFAKSIPFQQVVLSNKCKKYDCLQDAENSACRVFNSNHFIQWICQRLQNAVNHDPHKRKSQFIFLI